MTAPALLCAALEVAANRHLALEPSALEECTRLQGRVLAIALSEPAWTFYLEFMPERLRVLSEFSGNVEVRVSAPPRVLLDLARRAAQGDTGLPQGLRVEGDPELLTRLAKLLARVGFDGAEILARYLGDAAAHRVWGGLTAAFGWGRQTASTLALDTAEYLREETYDLARGSDVATWVEQVEDLRDGAARLESRLARLEARA